AQRGSRLHVALRQAACPSGQAGHHGRFQRHPGGGRGPVRRPALRPDAAGTHGNPNERATITRMSADDLTNGPEDDLYEEAPPRSIFATMWFRALLVLMVLAGVVAVAAPYILDATN